jgi:hypothetical protein
MVPNFLLALAAANTSAYTPLVLDRCRVIEEIEEGAGVRFLCPGHAGVALYVNAGDGRFDLDAGVDNGEWESLYPFNHLGPRVEWRMRGRVPVAAIYRVIVDSPESTVRSALVVESIGRPGRPGCLTAVINGALPNANALARADADRAAAHRCGAEEPVWRGMP